VGDRMKLKEKNVGSHCC